MTAAAKDRQYVTALARGLQVLTCFDASRTELGTSEIARLTGLPQPTVWRLCYTLLRDGYLVQSEHNDKLRPGVPVLGLGYSAIAATPIADFAHPSMQALATRHQGAVSLATVEGTNMIYLQRVQGSQIIMRNMTAGSRVPVLTSATGWAYLAGLEPQRRKRMLSQLQQAEPDLYAQMLPKIQRAFKQYERTGYIVNKGLLHPQINGVAVPVVSADHSRLLALSSGGINQVFTDAKLAEVGPELKELAATLAPALSAQHLA
jgi:DNA-binding IclR family transcriptional regulator